MYPFPCCRSPLLLSAIATMLALGTASGAERPEAEHSGLVARLPASGGRHVEYSADGRHLLTLGRTRAWVWNATTYERVEPAFEHGGVIYAAHLSPDGKLVLTSGVGGTILWDIATGRPILPQPLDADAPGSGSRACFSPNGTRVLTWNRDESARVWDVRTGKCLLELPHERKCEFAAFSPDGTRIVTAERGMVSCWNAGTGKRLFRNIEVGDAAIRAAFSPDNRRLVLAGIQEFMVVDAANGEAVSDNRDFNPGKDLGYVEAVAFSPDGKSVATLTNTFARLWDPTTGKPQSGEFGDGTVDVIQFSPDAGRYIRDGLFGAGIWEVAGQKRHQSLGAYPNFLFDSASFSPDGRHVATGYPHGKGETIVWKVKLEGDQP